jgi:hypothetical protein
MGKTQYPVTGLMVIGCHGLDNFESVVHGKVQGISLLPAADNPRLEGLVVIVEAEVGFL